jgi:predicted nucleotidyltransferase
VVVTISNLRRAAIERVAALSIEIVPAPASLVVFGSFARGNSNAASDIDVLAVRPPGLSWDDAWTDSLGSWVDRTTRIIGNPVNLIEAAAEEIPGLLRRKGPSVWRDAATEGIVLTGSPLSAVAAAA